MSDLSNWLRWTVQQFRSSQNGKLEQSRAPSLLRMEMPCPLGGCHEFGLS